MTTITIILDGKRGAKYRLISSQMGQDVGGGILWRLQKQITSKRSGVSWSDVASTREETNDPGSRILAGWLTTRMPLKELGELVGPDENIGSFNADKAAVKDYNT